MGLNLNNSKDISNIQNLYTDNKGTALRVSFKKDNLINNNETGEIEQSYISLSDTVINNQGEKDPLSETIDDGSFIEQEMNDAIYESLNLLNNKDREILTFRFGLNNSDELSEEELARIYKKSLGEIKQRISAALTNMKNILSTMI